MDRISATLTYYCTNCNQEFEVYEPKVDKWIIDMLIEGRWEAIKEGSVGMMFHICNYSTMGFAQLIRLSYDSSPY